MVMCSSQSDADARSVHARAVASRTPILATTVIPITIATRTANTASLKRTGAQHPWVPTLPSLCSSLIHSLSTGARESQAFRHFPGEKTRPFAMSTRLALLKIRGLPEHSRTQKYEIARSLAVKNDLFSVFFDVKL